MGTYSTEEYMELFGGLPEPGEAHPSLEAADNLRKREREEGLHCHRDLSKASPGEAPSPPQVRSASPGGGPSYCPACGAPKDAPCAPGVRPTVADDGLHPWARRALLGRHDCAAIRRQEDVRVDSVRPCRWQCTCGTVYQLEAAGWEPLFRVPESSSLRRKS